VFENRVLRRIFGPEREEVQKDRQSYTVRIKMSYSRVIRSRKMIWAGHADKALAEKHERKNRLGRPTHRWEDNIKMPLIQILGEFEHHMCNSRWGKWRVVLNTVMNFRIP
jgi:hypothetical protein